MRPRNEPIPAVRLSWAGPRGTGVALLALGVVGVLATADVPAGGDGWSPTGPRAFPLVASIGLIACSIGVLFRAIVRPDADLGAHAAAEAAATDWAVPVAIGGLLLGYVAALEPVGYVLATAVFFPLSSRTLGSRAVRRDVLAGAAIAVGVDLLFTQLLGVTLPAGPLGF